MRERKVSSMNVEIFFDIMAAFKDNPSLLEAVANNSVVPLPEDNPELAKINYKNAEGLPLGKVVFLKLSKSKGSSKYDTFAIKEPPIDFSE